MAVAYLGLLMLSMVYLDQPLAYACHELHLNEHSWLAWSVSALGSNTNYITLFALLIVYFRYVKPWVVAEARTWFLAACVVLSTSVCLVLKVLLGRARPELLFQDHLYGFFGLKTHAVFWSFPSGHTTTVMSMVAGLSLIFPRGLYAWLTLGILVLGSRIALTKHFLSDVLAAWGLAFLVVWCLYGWLKRKKPALFRNVFPRRMMTS
jgi:membrane-associated phospholipid phosphatase